MDWNIAQYGILGAALLALLQLTITKLPFVAGRLYNDRLARDKEEREERRRREDRLIELVQNNTVAMTRTAETLSRLDDTMHEIKTVVTDHTTDITRILDYLNLTRPQRPVEGLILPQDLHKEVSK